jgi:prepilin-type N-terminal cleavage/methylation domain-containing protein
MLIRRGVTLLELLVVLVVGGGALGLIAAISVRQQRIFSDLADAGALASQLREAAAILPIDLRSVSAAAGDVREARDTSIELRATIASAVVCDTVGGTLVLAPSSAGVTAYAGTSAAIEAGDTAWVFGTPDSTSAWQPFRVASASSTTPGNCAATAPQLPAADRLLGRTAIVLELSPSAALVLGSPLRVTRPLRYSLYRASDGGWYLGEKDWNNATHKFNTIQPVSGPFLAAAAGGLTFSYADSAGQALPAPVANMQAIASVQADVRGQTRNPMRALAAASASGKRGDSASIVIFLRNRR